EATGSARAEGHGKKWSLERQLVCGAHVFTHIVDAVTGANRSGVMTEEIVGHSDPRTDARGIIVAVSAVAASRIEPGNIQALHARSVNKGVAPGIGELLIQVSYVALIIVKSAEFLDPQAEVECQAQMNFPIVLRE